MQSKSAIAALVLTGLACLAAPASANPRPLPFTYTYETLPEGDTELEQFVDFTPLRALSGATGDPTWYAATQLQTEFEYGITNRLELGLYVTVVPQPNDALVALPTLMEGNGAKQRLRLRLAEEGELPIDVGFYGEVAENEREIELEAKIILQKRLGDLRIVANLWAEREFYYAGEQDWVLNPTLGLTYQVSPLFHPGVEGWMRVEFPGDAPSPRPFNLGPHYFVGLVGMLSFGKLWWTTGAYLRLNDFGRKTEAGDAFGSVWIRTALGIGL